MASWKTKAMTVAGATALALIMATPAFATSAPGTDEYDLSSSTVQAGGDVTITGGGWDSTLLDGATNPVAVINFETPAPPVGAPGGGVGGGGSPGTDGGTSIVNQSIPATADAWTYTFTVPLDTPAGSGYHVCIVVQTNPGFGDFGCADLTITAATIAVTSQATVGGTLTYSGEGFTPGETVSVIAHSVAIVIGTTTASSGGAVSGTVTLPASLPLGAHNLQLLGSSSGFSLTAPFTIGVVPSAATDVVVPSNGLWVVGGAVLLLLLISALAVFAARRARAVA